MKGSLQCSQNFWSSCSSVACYSFWLDGSVMKCEPDGGSMTWRGPKFANGRVAHGKRGHSKTRTQRGRSCRASIKSLGRLKCTFDLSASTWLMCRSSTPTGKLLTDRPSAPGCGPRRSGGGDGWKPGQTRTGRRPSELPQRNNTVDEMKGVEQFIIMIDHRSLDRRLSWQQHPPA
jgi:hypothetical protein